MSNKHNRKPGTLVISLDFEMFWGLADFAREDEWAPIIHGVHDVVPRLLNLFQEFGVHATWATVGALMCDNKEEFINMLPYPHAAQTEKVIRRLQLSDDSQNPKLDKMLFAPEYISVIVSFSRGVLKFFMPSENVNLEAIYVEAEIEVKEEGTAFIESVTKNTTDKN